MELKDIANIRKIDITKEIQASINAVRVELKFLTEDRTCKIYNSYLYEELSKRHIPVRVINTLDLGLDYEHLFLLVNNTSQYYLLDLTFSQFNTLNLYWENLVVNGYISVDDNLLREYLAIMGSDNLNITLDDVYYGEYNRRQIK